MTRRSCTVQAWIIALPGWRSEWRDRVDQQVRSTLIRTTQPHLAYGRRAVCLRRRQKIGRLLILSAHVRLNPIDRTLSFYFGYAIAHFCRQAKIRSGGRMDGKGAAGESKLWAFTALSGGEPWPARSSGRKADKSCDGCSNWFRISPSPGAQAHRVRHEQHLRDPGRRKLILSKASGGRGFPNDQPAASPRSSQPTLSVYSRHGRRGRGRHVGAARAAHARSSNRSPSTQGPAVQDHRRRLPRGVRQRGAGAALRHRHSGHVARPGRRPAAAHRRAPGRGGARGRRPDGRRRDHRGPAGTAGGTRRHLHFVPRARGRLRQDGAGGRRPRRAGS